MRYINKQRFVKASQTIIEETGGTDPGGGTGGEVGISKIEMLNTSSIRLEAGHIVRLNENQENAVEAFPQYNPFQPHPFGIVLTPGNPNELVQVMYGGITDVNMDQAQVRIGDYLYNSATPGLLTPSDGGFIGAIGRALSAKPNGTLGTVRALIGYLPHLG